MIPNQTLNTTSVCYKDFISAIFVSELIKLNSSSLNETKNTSNIKINEEIETNNQKEPINSLRKKDITLALELAKKALTKDPNYVDYDFRKEQLWGEKLQTSTEILLQNDQLKSDVTLAKSKINSSS